MVMGSKSRALFLFVKECRVIYRTVGTIVRDTVRFRTREADKNQAKM